MPELINDKLMSWAVGLEDEARLQSERVSRLPFVHGHVALMADAHYGMGCTVGTVLATDGAVIPAAVGVDLGCGMMAIKLDIEGRALTSQDLPDDLSVLHHSIAWGVPSGVGKGHERGMGPAGDSMVTKHADTSAWKSMKKLERKALEQMGSLGSGNHFVEVSLDENDEVWVVLHSGSRGVGNQLAQYHIGKARGVMTAESITLEDKDLAYLTENTPEFNEYIEDMLWAQDYALENRETMMREVHKDINYFLGIKTTIAQKVQCHHNFTQQEEWDDTSVWVTRKGAIQAHEGQLGIIPGSMGTSTYIVAGRGNPASFASSSHGAGRKMSRGRARRELDVAGLMKAMEGKAWDSSHAKHLIDEDPRSYKDIEEIMELQAGLTTIVHKLHQILNYKGTS